MTKLSRRVPNIIGQSIADWLKELAEYVEFIDRREEGLREEAAWKKKTQKVGLEYEPQTYDEAIALIKGWKRYPETGLARWESPSGDRVVFDFGKCSASWENHKWPELWKEMVEALHRGSMYLYENEWTFNLPAYQRYRDSTPGRVVCQAYLYYRNRRDWAERLSKGK